MEFIKANREIEYDFKSHFKDIKRFLIEKFLYDADGESVNILLNIYEVEDNIETIYPTYISLRHLKKDIIKFLRNKEGKELISYNLSNLIHDDVNRYELFMYLEGYRAGLNASKNVNRLEILTLKYLNVDDIYSRKRLFNREISNKEINILKEKLFYDLRNDKKVKRHIYDIVFKFNLKVLKRKVFELNSHVDKQMVLDLDNNDYSSTASFRETNSNLSKRELFGLNKKIFRFLIKDGMKIFENAYWDGINDKVMKRYK